MKTLENTRNIRVNVLSPGGVDTPCFSRTGASEEQIAGIKDYMATSFQQSALEHRLKLPRDFYSWPSIIRTI
jgi:NAD(P)-dependent dehydrogenase (short-subunit alcohol dehydrogenase family)